MAIIFLGNDTKQKSTANFWLEIVAIYNNRMEAIVD